MNNQNDSMPDIVTKEFNGGHDLKTSPVAGFEKDYVNSKLYNVYGSTLVRFFSRASRWMQMQIIMVKKE